MTAKPSKGHALYEVVCGFCESLAVDDSMYCHVAAHCDGSDDCDGIFDTVPAVILIVTPSPTVTQLLA
ncbi:MAG: hypothetical protein IJ364_05875 [Oscillospiraceae bacterium]|nr:hypothetical protein [Oscillospiraceae bacterium]